MTLSFLLFFAFYTFAIPIERRQAAPVLPEYITKYAPIVYLHSSDHYLPSDIKSQISETEPQVDRTAISGAPSPLTLDNLNDLNNLGGKDIYLTSQFNVEGSESWLSGQMPDETGKTTGATSAAIVVNDHGDGIVDAFYMYFYAFNPGKSIFDHSIGNHVGDWEHNMIRFRNGEPQAIWYSQHSNGQAFHYDIVEKHIDGLRPICYSANGSHANYAMSGTHAYGIPNMNLPDGVIKDETDKGPMWDPALSAYYYSFDAASQTFSAYDDGTSVNWLYFEGRWGDEQYADSDPRQDSIWGIDGSYKYVSGPTGPLFKGLNRKTVCPDNDVPCIVRHILVP